VGTQGTQSLHQYCIWVVSPEGYQHSGVFADLAESLESAFVELGGSAPITTHPSEWAGRSPVVLGANLLPFLGNLTLPRDTIIINLEQVTQGSPWMSDEYLSFLSRSRVLDYSPRNLKALHDLGISHARLLQVGYSPRSSKISHDAIKDIDVLFYGSVNPRRAAVLDALKSYGLTVGCLIGVYGKERDDFIARSKLVLNVHYYESNIFEVVRVFYLLANKVCVVSEGFEEDEDVQRFVGGIAFAGYDTLVQRCLDLVANPADRTHIAQSGYDRISKHRQSTLLKDALKAIE
jgi:hypothetical protein